MTFLYTFHRDFFVAIIVFTSSLDWHKILPRNEYPKTLKGQHCLWKNRSIHSFSTPTFSFSHSTQGKASYKEQKKVKYK